MSAPLSLADVERIAALAQLELTDDEKRLFAKQLAEILEYARQVQQIDTGAVPPTAHILSTPGNAAGTEREDEPRPSLAVDEALGNAADASRRSGLFRVPRVIGG